jgi:ATP-binding cassette subfamily C protein CydC
MTSPVLDTLVQEATKPSSGAMRAAALCAVAAAVASVLLLGISGWFITGAALAGAAGVLAVQAFNYLIPSAGIRLLAIVRTVAHYGERLQSHGAALTSLARVRAALFRHILQSPDPRRWASGDVATRLTQDIAALEDRLVRTPLAPGAIAGGIVGVALTALTGWAPAALLALLLIALPIATARLAPRWLDGPARAVSDAMGLLKGQMTATLAATPEIAAYGMAPAIASALEEQAGELDRARATFARRDAAIAALAPLCGGAAMAAVLLLGSGGPALTILAILAAAASIEAQSGWLRGLLRDAPARSALARLTDLATRREHSDPVPVIETRAGSFTLLLGDARLTAQPGDRIAIIGRSGAGKTRLLDWLAGLDPAAAPPGPVDVAGLPTDTAKRRALFSAAPQDAMQLSGSVADNLRLARTGLADAQLWEALDIVGLADDVRAMPHGIDQWIGDGGARLSGGQRKRLSVARALLAARPWLLLDEPSEGLDSVLEARLKMQLDLWLRATGTGLILVSHRPALLPLCGKQIDLDGHSIRANNAADAPRGRDD